MYPPSRDFAHVARPLGAKPPISPNRPSRARSPIGRTELDGRAGTAADRAFAAAADLAILLAVGERSVRGERLAVISVVGGGSNSRRPNIASDPRDVFSKVGQSDV